MASGRVVVREDGRAFASSGAAAIVLIAELGLASKLETVACSIRRSANSGGALTAYGHRYRHETWRD